MIAAENSPIPALHSDTGASGTLSSNPACSSEESVANGAIGFVIGSIVLVALYRVLPPPGTPLMLIRRVEGYRIDKSWRPLEPGKTPGSTLPADRSQ
jgi:hypothetical protein